MRIVIVLLFFFVCHINAHAQDTLPKFTVNHVTNNVLVSWTNPFTSLTTINIQRSFDSTKNFTTIGSVLDVKNRRNGFVDPKPVSYNMFYRLFLSFEGGTYIFTPSQRPVLDTSKAPPSLKDLQQSTVVTGFVPSKRVYSGKDNNVIINLPGALNKKYVVKFFDENGFPLFEINKINETYLTIEKVNFVHAGTFTFEIYEDGLLIEKYKFYIGKEGKPTQNLNEDKR